MTYLLVFGFSLLAIYLFNLPVWGKSPKGKRLERIQQSKNWDGKEFKNLEPTPQLTGGATMPQLIWEMIQNKNIPNLEPKTSLPSIKTDLKNLKNNQWVWLGHSSYIFKLEDKIFLMDPVISGNASPFSSSLKSFKGSDIYKTADFPEIDFLLISHDHYDHLDYRFTKEIRPKVKQVVCGLGVGQHFEYWGYEADIIQELDWYEQLSLTESIQITSTPARHFSGRFLKRNNTLWTSYVLKTTELNLFLGGDSGYGKHFKTIGEKYGPFDIAILENGQYNLYWANIHSFPNQIPTIAQELKAQSIIPVHSAKFALAKHAWNEPLELAYQEAQKHSIRLLTPQIGQLLELKDSTQLFSPWWHSLN